MTSPPAGLAKFDSATAMLRAQAAFLHGRAFAGLGQGAMLRRAVRLAEWVPRRLRQQLFSRLGAREGVPPGEIEALDTDRVAEWAAAQYPARQYPAVMIGAASGALVHLAAAFGIPWLPQTYLALVRQEQVHPDDPVGAMERARAPAARFLARNPGVQLHHLHDPSQDRLMLGRVTYFRFKYRRLPPAYRRFIGRSLAPGGAIVVANCGQRWPVTRVGERHFFQCGAVGGPSVDEYFHGGPRVADYLARHGSPVRQWRPPPSDAEAAEAEWGFEPALAEDLAAFARDGGHPVLELDYRHPEHPSPAIAELYRAWNAERGIAQNRLVVESFIVLEPYWVLRTGSVPFWTSFAVQPSLEAVERYLAAAEPYEHLHLMLFAHGIDSVGVPPIEAWQALLARARRGGSLLGLTPRNYPAHFSHFARYSDALRSLPGHYPLPPPLPIERLGTFIEHWRTP